MSLRSSTFVIAVILAAAVPRSLAAETLRIASPQRGSWEGAIPELGKEAGIFQKQGLTLTSCIPKAAARPLCNSGFSLRPFRRTS